MQKNTKLPIVILTVFYTVLFYCENAGLNFLIFSILLVSATTWINPTVIKRKNVFLFGVTSILSGAAILINPTDLAILTNIMSLLLFSAASHSIKASVPINFLNGVYSLGGSIAFIILNIIESIKQKSEGDRKSQKFLIYLATCLIIIIFISIYKTINPLFDKYTKLLILDFFGLKWMLFTTGGLLLMYGFIKPQHIPNLNKWEVYLERPLKPNENSTLDHNKKQAFTFLFVVLNGLLLFITLLDIKFLYFGSGLPEGVTHKQFVHNGVGMLIFSILFGIAIILYVFGGDLNFDKNNRILKLLVYGWIVMNLLMVISTAMRNNLYITEALLTYKRIGVYYWLVLAAAGLIITLFKIYKIKRAWYLIRKASLFAYLLLVVSCPIDWDNYISEYNLSRIKDIAALDKKYLIDLSEANIKQLYAIKYHAKFEIDSVYHYNYKSLSSNKQDLDRKLFYFLYTNENKGWKSFNFRRKRVMQDIQTLNARHALDTLDLTKVSKHNLSCITPLTNLKNLRLSYQLRDNDENMIQAINRLKNLETLRFRIWDLKDTAILKQIRNIKTLYLDFPDSQSEYYMLSKLKLPYRIVLVGSR